MGTHPVFRSHTYWAFSMARHWAPLNSWKTGLITLLAGTAMLQSLSVKYSVIPRRKAVPCKSPEAEARVTVITEAQPLDTILGLCLVRPATPWKSLECKAFPTEVCTLETGCGWWQAGTSYQPPWGLMAASWAYTFTKRCPAYLSISGCLISKSKQRTRREVK